MTDRTESRADDVAAARGLWDVSAMMMAGRVTVDTDWQDRNRRVVMVDVTGYPVTRAELIAALGSPEPEDWAGETGARYRDWRGTLLTMRVVVTEQTIRPASDPAGEIVPGPAPVPSCPGADEHTEGPCGEPGPHAAHELGAMPATTVPGTAEAWAEPGTRAAWRVYTAGRCRAALRGQTFPNLARALAAVDRWAGRGTMLEPDVQAIAAELVATPSLPALLRPFAGNSGPGFRGRS